MKKEKTDKPKKERAKNYEKSLKVNGSFSDVISLIVSKEPDQQAKR